MSTKIYTIPEFKGMDQSKSENLLNPSYSPDACNMDTENGHLKVAKGYAKQINTRVPDTELEVMGTATSHHRVYVWKASEKAGSTHYIFGYNTGPYVANDGRLVHYKTGWEQLLSVPRAIPGTNRFNTIEWAFVETNLVSDVDANMGLEQVLTKGVSAEHLLIATLNTRMYKWNGVTAVEPFGSGEFSYESTVVSYSNKTVTVVGAIGYHARNRMMLAGVMIAGTNHAVESVDQTAKTITLKTAPTTAPVANDTVKASGGRSNHPVSYIAMHYGRLFASGDYTNPNRLYWSQVPGDYRSIEDWTADDASPDSGGGFVDIGSLSDPIIALCAMQNQLLIFKVRSVYRLLGDRPQNYRVVRVSEQAETAYGITLYDETPIWMTAKGIRYFDGQNIRPLGNVDAIQGFLNNANLGYCKGARLNNKLYYIAGESGQSNNVLIVYDIVNKSYMLRRGLIVLDLFCKGGILYMVNDKGYVYKMETGTTYDGAPINAYWTTPISDLNGKMENKKLVRMYLRGTAENNAPIRIESRAGKYVKESIVAMPETEYEVKEIPLENEGRVVGFKFSNDSGGHFEIKGGVQVEFSVTGGT